MLELLFGGGGRIGQGTVFTRVLLHAGLMIISTGLLNFGAFSGDPESGLALTAVLVIGWIAFCAFIHKQRQSGGSALNSLGGGSAAHTPAATAFEADAPAGASEIELMAARAKAARLAMQPAQAQRTPAAAQFPDRKSGPVTFGKRR